MHLIRVRHHYINLENVTEIHDWSIADKDNNALTIFFNCTAEGGRSCLELGNDEADDMRAYLHRTAVNVDGMTD